MNTELQNPATTPKPKNTNHLSEWREYKLGDVADLLTGFPFKGNQYEMKGNLKVVRGENVSTGNLRWDSEKHWNKSTVGLEKYFLSESDIVIGMDGSKVGQNRAIIKREELPLILAQRVARIRAKKGFNQKFIWYHIFSNYFKEYIQAIHTGTSIPHISLSQISEFEILVPGLKEQQAIASVLSSLDDKIDLLHRQNRTLEQLAETLFRQWFVEEAEESWEAGTLGNLFIIKIGRTPPRKEQHWFSTNPNDVKWISIKDLGNSGIYIDTVSEYLTKEAIERFSIPVIPSNTVLLSFKLTVGRVAITTEEMVSNEAIAHFKIKDNSKFYAEFLYLFLKSLNFSLLGSTSSIAEAINSQMIKEIEIPIPNENKLKMFKKEIEPVFQKIKSNTQQIRTLTALRDTLLPKLMSGEVRVNQINN
jgi:type I restriction enzyme S subunit